MFPSVSLYLILLLVPPSLHLPSSSSLSLCASRECQNKERLLEQKFRAALRDFQQWLVNAKISTAKCFDVPQSVAEATTSLQRIQVRPYGSQTLGP